MASEYFAYTKSMLSNDRSKITCKSFNETSYGNLTINSNDAAIHHWKLKIHKIKFKICKIESNSSPIIGISESTLTHCGKIFTSTGKGYGLCCNGNIYSINSKDKKTYFHSFSKQQFKTNDIIRMKLDLYQQTLSFSINNQEWIIIDEIKISSNIKYKIAVFLGLKDDCIQLLSYHKHQFSEFEANEDVDDDEKQSELNEYIKPNNSAIKLIESLREQLAHKMEKIEKYKKEIKRVALQRKEGYDALKICYKKIETLQAKLCSKMAEIDALKKENNILRQKPVENTMADKESKMGNVAVSGLKAEILRLRLENKQLRQEMVRHGSIVDISKYMTWNWQQILQWILKMENSRFKKYEITLRKMLHEEKPNGEDLGYVNEADIKRWGVTDFRDIKIFRAKLDELINANNDNNEDGQIRHIQNEQHLAQTPMDNDGDNKEANDEYAASDRNEKEGDGKKGNIVKQYVDEEYSYSASDEYYDRFAMVKRTSFYVEDKDKPKTPNPNPEESVKKMDIMSLILDDGKDDDDDIELPDGIKKIEYRQKTRSAPNSPPLPPQFVNQYKSLPMLQQSGNNITPFQSPSRSPIQSPQNVFHSPLDGRYNGGHVLSPYQGQNGVFFENMRMQSDPNGYNGHILHQMNDGGYKMNIPPPPSQQILNKYKKKQLPQAPPSQYK